MSWVTHVNPLVLKRQADILSVSYAISIYQLHSNIFVDIY